MINYSFKYREQWFKKCDKINYNLKMKNCLILKKEWKNRKVRNQKLNIKFIYI